MQIVKRSAISFGACLAFHFTPSHASEPIALELQPSSSWNADWGQDRCTLLRTFGDGNGDVLLRIRSAAPGNVYHFELIGKALAPFKDLQGQALVRFGNEGDELARGTEFVALEGDRYALVFSSGVDFQQHRGHAPNATKAKLGQEDWPLETDKLARVTSIAIREKERSLTLHSGSLVEALNALSICTDDLARSASVNPAPLATLSQRTRLSNGASIVPGPTDQKKLGRTNGSVDILAAIDETGKPLSCRSPVLTANKELLDAVCRSVMAAKFEPALDADGKRVADFYRVSVAVFQRR
ncbi:hypothetical protein MTR62_04760 [Novosphingobium sp. 1949]|uniref:TonB C-terminal domain-containing protein n=1 Tax=Novosphingobium organovorum TaxID=2930092 RepID=A0ABT0BAB7_9SPHN|nr:hypothetical protein [Novosphingobium organovorum]MCJ2182015.1 hypothetical protein [Novosphingobium organovorum]